MERNDFAKSRYQQKRRTDCMAAKESDLMESRPWELAELTPTSAQLACDPAELVADFAPRLRDAIAELSDDERAVIVARWFEGRTLREIADECGVTPERIRQRENQALAHLRRRLESSLAAKLGRSTSRPSRVLGKVGDEWVAVWGHHALREKQEAHRRSLAVRGWEERLASGAPPN